MLEDPRAQLKQAYTLIKDGQKPQALAMLKTLTEQQPDNADGWWLTANTAPSPQLAAEACERVLALRPDYAPAVQFLSEQQLLEALSLIEEKKKPEARALIQAVLDKQPSNTRAWWLMAKAAPSQIDSVFALQTLLAIEPENTAARQMLMDLQQQSAKGLAQKHKAKDTKPKVRKTRLWFVFGLLGMIGLMLGGGYFAMNLTGVNFGLPVGGFFNARYNIGTLGEKPVAKSGSLIVGAKHEYTFYGNINTHVLVLVVFPILRSDPSKAVTIFGTDNKALAMSKDANMSIGAQYDVVLPTTGYFTVRITGTADIAQGPYQLYLATVPDDANFSSFGDMTQP